MMVALTVSLRTRCGPRRRPHPRRRVTPSGHWQQCWPPVYHRHRHYSHSSSLRSSLSACTFTWHKCQEERCRRPPRRAVHPAPQAAPRTSALCSPVRCGRTFSNLGARRERCRCGVCGRPAAVGHGCGNPVCPLFACPQRRSTGLDLGAAAWAWEPTGRVRACMAGSALLSVGGGGVLLEPPRCAPG